MINKFSEVSIRGRLAFACYAFELYLEKQGYTNAIWEQILDKFWSFSNSKFIEDWHDETIEYHPECILEFTEYDLSNDWEYISASTFQTLQSLYRNLPDQKELDFLMNSITSICGIELYGAIVHPAKQSLKILEELIDFLEKRKLPIPKYELFTHLSIHERDGWGDLIRKDEITTPK